MFDQNIVTTLSGATVRDAGGEKIGKVAQVYLDDKTGQPEWVTVRTGMFGGRESFVPLSAARLEGDELVVDGNLTIKGDTRPVTGRGELVAPHEDPWGNTRLGITLEAAVDRTHFGLSWNNPLPKGGLALANDVKLHVDLQLVKAQP